MSEGLKRFELHVTRSGETTCLALLGEFDFTGFDQLEEELERAEGRDGRAVVDLRGLKLTDSSGSTDDTLGRDPISPSPF